MTVILLNCGAEAGTQIVLAAGHGFAFPVVSEPSGGVLEVLALRTGSATGAATAMRMALLKDNAGKPGALIEEKVLTNAEVAEGKWGNTGATVNEKEKERLVGGFNTSITPSTKYWIVLMPTGGAWKMHLTGSGSSSAEIQRSTGGELTAISLILGWEGEVEFTPAFVRGTGKEASHIVSAVSSSAVGTARVSTSTVRKVALAQATATGTAFAVNPASKGVPHAVSAATGAARASVSTVRQLQSVKSVATGEAKITPLVYGRNEVYRYSTAAHYPQQNVIAGFPGSAPGSITAIFFHESAADEPTHHAFEHGEDGLPQPGEAFPIPVAKTRTPVDLLQGSTYAEATTNARGWATFVPTYRESDNGSGSELVIGGNLTNLEDIEAAVAWVKQHCAAWNGDPNKIVLIAASFGVTEALHVACRLNEVHGAGYIKGVAGLSGTADLPKRLRERNEEVEIYNVALNAYKFGPPTAHPEWKAEKEAFEAVLKSFEKEWKKEHSKEFENSAEEENALNEAVEKFEAEYKGSEYGIWQAESQTHRLRKTVIAKKIGNYISTTAHVESNPPVAPGYYSTTPTGSPSAGEFEETGWLEGPSEEQKKLLALAEKLSVVNNLGITMPYLYYAVTKTDIVPQSQLEQLEAAAAMFGQPGKLHCNSTVTNGHGWGFWPAVHEEIWNYLELAVNPPVVPFVAATATASNRIVTQSVRHVGVVRSPATALSSVQTSTTRVIPAIASSAVGQVRVVTPGIRLSSSATGVTRVSISTLRKLASVTGSAVAGSNAAVASVRHVTRVLSASTAVAVAETETTRNVPFAVSSATGHAFADVPSGIVLVSTSTAVARAAVSSIRQVEFVLGSATGNSNIVVGPLHEIPTVYARINTPQTLTVVVTQH